MRRLAALLMVFALASSCRQIAGIDDRTTSAPLCGFEAHSTCGACTAQACCAEEQACTGTCKAAFTCLLGCTDDACRVQCRLTHQSGFTGAEGVLAACQARACQEACTLSCGGYVYPSAGCATCSAASCCTEAAACSSDGQCLAMSYCARACNDDAACIAACKRDHLEGATEADTFSRCLVDHCAQACGDPAWACLGKGAWPDVGKGDVQIKVTVHDAVNRGIVPGALVKACRADDVQCATPYATGTTSELGVTEVMTVPAGLTAYFEMSGDGYMSTLLYGPLPVVYAQGVTPYDGPLIPASYLHDTFGAVAPIDATRGSVVANFADCEANVATGIALDAAPADGATLAYPNGFGWSTTLADSGDAPQAVWLNLPAPHFITLTARVAKLGAVLESQTVIVRPDVATWVILQPPPLQ